VGSIPTARTIQKKEKMIHFLKGLKKKKKTIEKTPEEKPKPVQVTQTFDWTGRNVRYD
jgi:hypothetical protein